jgi:hypothetical protein
MSNTIILFAAFLFGAAPAVSQIKLDLDHLAKVAKESTEITLDASLLQMAGRFLSASKPDEAKVKSLVSNLEGIYVRSFEFDKPDQWSQADLEPLRKQLTAPGWTRIVRHTESGKESLSAFSEIHVLRERGKTKGITILSGERKELTIVHIQGDIDLDQLGDLSGQFGIPRLPRGLNK